MNYNNNSNFAQSVEYLDLLSDVLLDLDVFDLELRSELVRERERDLDLLLEWRRSTLKCHQEAVLTG